MPKKFYQNPILMVYITLMAGFFGFSGTVYTSAVPEKNTPVNELALQGKMLWQKHNCSACHQFYGLGGYLGPDLTNTISAKGKGRQYAAAIMQSGTSVMPNFNLEPVEIEALLAFLEQADKSGNNAVHSYEMNLNGTITSKGEGRE